MKKPFWVILLILCLELTIIFVLIPSKMSESATVTEARMIDSQMGIPIKNKVHLKAQRWYQTHILDSGLHEKVYQFLLPTQEDIQRKDGFENFARPYFVWLEKRLDVLFSVVYQVITRIMLLSIWLPYLLVIWIPALLDGYLTWKLKCTNFAYASPLIHQVSIKGCFWILIFMIIFILLPVALPPLIFPVLMILLCLLSGTMLANMQKRF